MWRQRGGRLWLLIILRSGLAMRGGSGGGEYAWNCAGRQIGYSRGMDDALKQKLQIVFDAVSSVARERGLFLDEQLQLIADTLINHPDPELRAFQEAHNRQVDKRLN
jgi:hypothetical protein